MKQKLIKKIRNRKIIVGIIGLGYVGLPLLIRFSEVKINVLGFDIDENKVDKLKKRKSYFKHIPSKKLNEISKCYDVTSNFSNISNVDIIIICLPTPLNKYREPDLSFIQDTLTTIKPFLKKGQLISLESTTYPGTTDEIVFPIIQSTGLKIGKEIFLTYSPEREDPGNKIYNTKNIPKIIGGYTKSCLQVGVSIYSKAIDVINPVSSTKVAEMSKLLENIYRSVNIGLANEMKIVADEMGIDIYEVIHAASTKPFGFTPFYPGPGLGGHCIPIDPFYLTWKAREFGINTRFIELAGEINTNMPNWIIEKISDKLNDQNKSIKGSKFLIIGIAYKKDIGDMRESPAIKIMKLLESKGAIINYSDPFFPKFPKVKGYKNNSKSIPLNKLNINKYDVLIIATNHSKFNYSIIQKYGRLVIDTRGVYQKNYNNVVKA